MPRQGFFADAAGDFYRADVARILVDLGRGQHSLGVVVADVEFAHLHLPH